MNEQKLSKRLTTVVKYVPENARLADIGTDHAYLPVSLALKGKIEYAVASDVVKGPFESAVEQIKKSGVQEIVHPRLASGFDGVKRADKIDTITIAGMGGSLIAEILRDGLMSLHLTGKERLILQPNVHSQAVRIWLVNHNYEIIAEEILEENDKIYEVIVAEKQKEKTELTDNELLFGPILLREKSPVFIQKWQGELEKNEKVLATLENANSDNDWKVNEFTQIIEQIHEVLSENVSD